MKKTVNPLQILLHGKLISCFCGRFNVLLIDFYNFLEIDLPTLLYKVSESSLTWWEFGKRPDMPEITTLWLFRNELSVSPSDGSTFSCGASSCGIGAMVLHFYYHFKIRVPTVGASVLRQWLTKLLAHV